MSEQGTAPPSTDDVAEREALRGQFWRSAQQWVPRTGYTAPRSKGLRDVETELRRLL